MTRLIARFGTHQLSRPRYVQHFSHSPSAELVSRAKMPKDERIGVGAAFQGRHPRVYTFLCQLIIAIVTFYCAIAISRYGPERDPIPASAVPGTVAPRTPLSDANSTTPHICKNGAREDVVDIGAALIVSSSFTSSLSPFTLPHRSEEHTDGPECRQ